MGRWKSAPRPSMRAPARCLTALALLAICVNGCGFFDLKCKLEQVVDEAGSKLIGNALSAFEQAMDHLIDQDIDPMIDKAQAAIDAEIKQVSAEVNETINHIESSIKSIVHDAAQTANALASNVTKDVEQIIAAGSDAVQKAEGTFYKDASALLDQINIIVQKVSCMEEAGVKQLQDQIYKLLEGLNPMYRLSSCWRGLGYKITQNLESLTDLQLYNYQKQCTLLDKITPTTPIQGPNGILQMYAQGQLYAAQYKCIGQTSGSPAFQDVFAKEWVWWGVQYNAWNNIKVKSKQRQLSENTLVTPLSSDPCGTPVECYAQAIKALNEAEQKIAPLQAAVVQINQTLLTNEADIKTNTDTIASINQTLLTNEANIKNNTDTIASNSADIASNNPRKLTMGWCNCSSYWLRDAGRTACPVDSDHSCDPYICPEGFFMNAIQSADSFQVVGRMQGMNRGVDAFKCCRPCFI